jgi:uncharacterized protein (TIGR02145 family)
MNYTRNTMYSTYTRSICLLLVFSALAGCNSGVEQEETREQIKDIEGNSYNTVQIGDQLWMAEDLKSTLYNDGSHIPLVENYDEWANLTLPAYSWYNNDSSNAENFGALYNWYVLESEKLCPEGWHVPSDEEWIALESILGGAGLAGGALKEEGTKLWKTPNLEASNESGFTARPGGYRSYNGTFNLMRTSGYWWSTSEKSWYGSSPKVLYRYLLYDDVALARHIAEKTNGFSVRCVKNP